MKPNMSPFFENLNRWEAIGRALDKTATAYLNSCKALDHPIPVYSPGAREMIWKIDERLRSIDDLVTRRLSLARSSLTRTRNRLAAPIFCLPDDILSRIFQIAVNFAEIETYDRSARHMVNARYRHLHALLGVCSTWRRVIVSQGSFWSIVPVVPQMSDRFMATAARLSLDRSAACRLHFVAELSNNRLDMCKFICDVLSQYGPRFKSVNIKGNCELTIIPVIHALIKGAMRSPGSLTHLSMCCHQVRMIGHAQFDWGFVYRPNGLEQAMFNRMLESLHILKLRGVDIDFTGITFKSLTELRLQAIKLQNNARLEGFLWALSSSPQLRTLEIISIIIPGNASESTTAYKFISLPALRLLYLEGLYQDTLNLVLASIKPGSYRVTLCLTSECLYVYRPEAAEIVGFHGLRLQGIRVDKLILTPRFIELSANGLRDLLELTPTVTSLHIDGRYLTSHSLDQIVRPTDSNSSFPKLAELNVTRCCVFVDDLDILKAAVASHPIGMLGLGITVCWTSDGKPPYHRFRNPHARLNSIRKWLWNTVPRVKWLPDGSKPESPGPEFESDTWSL
ncbi:hypothetical protein FRC11_006410 [Ceratobasidium sp. 423]|nr:hypothetical protein FRC11_006410 [Ceratobasidium sp. 423]